MVRSTGLPDLIISMILRGVLQYVNQFFQGFCSQRSRVLRAFLQESLLFLRMCGYKQQPKIHGRSY